MKKVRFGAGKYNGFGGKVGDKEEFKNETLEEAVKREGLEEFSIKTLTLYKVAEIIFKFPHHPDFDQIVHAYLCDKWIGVPKESEEMKPEWFKFSKIPYDKMWWDDQYWLPLVLDGKKLKAEFVFTPKEKILNQSIKEVGKFKEFKKNQ